MSPLTFGAAEIGNGPPSLPDVIDSNPKGRGKAKDGAPRIAIVDDDPWVRRSLDRLMKSAGFKTECFGSAEEFLEPADDFFGCMILDLKLPGMNGLELQRRLADEDRKIPIIFVSAHDDRASKSQALKAGATAFLTKPFGDETLLDAVDSVLRPGSSCSMVRKSDVIAKGVADSSQRQHPAKYRDRQHALQRKRENGAAGGCNGYG